MGLNREIATIDAASVIPNIGPRLVFERDYDDLDWFSAAVFTASGTQYAFNSMIISRRGISSSS